MYANPPAADLGTTDGGVVWRPWHAIESEESEGRGVDVLVSWRNLEGSTLLRHASSRYVWLQDIVDVPRAYHPRFVSALSGVLVLSRFHRRGLPPHAVPKAVLTANGIDASLLVPPWVLGALVAFSW